MLHKPPTGWAVPEKVCALAVSPRSGSGMLANMIVTSDSLGRPREWFNRGVAANHGIPPGAAIGDLCRLAVENGRTANGVVGIKMFATQFAAARKDIDFDAWFPHVSWVRLRRRGILRQAISLVMARQSGAWTSLEQGAVPATYDAAEIRSCMEAILREERMWADYFGSWSASPPPLFWYEDIVDHLPETVRAIADYVGVTLLRPPSLERMRFRKQASGENDEWVKRFADEEGAAEMIVRLDAERGAAIGITRHRPLSP